MVWLVVIHPMRQTSHDVRKCDQIMNHDLEALPYNAAFVKKTKIYKQVY